MYVYALIAASFFFCTCRNVCWSAASLYWQYRELHFSTTPPFSRVFPALLFKNRQRHRITEKCEVGELFFWTFRGHQRLFHQILKVYWLMIDAVLAITSDSVCLFIPEGIFIIFLDWWTVWAMNNAHKCIQITNSNSDIAQPLQTQNDGFISERGVQPCYWFKLSLLLHSHLHWLMRPVHTENWIINYGAVVPSRRQD